MSRVAQLLLTVVIVLAIVWVLAGKPSFFERPRPERSMVPPIEVKERVERPSLARAWINGGRVETEFAIGTLRQERIADLAITTGAIVAADAFIRDEVPPFAVVLPRGRHPVVLTIFEDQRVAYARVELTKTSTVPAVWKAAGGIAVDSGSAAFYDIAAAELEHGHDMFGDRLHVELAVDEETGANIVAFRAGYGDGHYPVFFGFDAAGAPSVVLIDFLTAAEREPFDVEAELAELEPMIAEENDAALVSRAHLHLRAGDLAAALADFDRVIRAHPTNSGYFLERGQIHMLRHDYLAAMSDAKSALDYAPNLGMSQEEAGAYRGPLDFVAPAIDSEAIADAFRLRAYALRGEAYNASGEHDDALPDLDRAIELLDRKVERFKKSAAKVGRSSPDLFAGEGAAIFGERARAKIALGDFDGAILDLERGRAGKPELAIELAFLYRRSGDEEKAYALIEGTVADARHELEKAKQRGRGYEEPHLQKLAAIHRAMKLPSSVVNILTELRAITGEPEVLVELAAAKLDVGDHAGAIEAATAAIKSTPRNAAAYFHRGRAAKAVGRAVEATADFERALQYSANAPRFGSL